MSLPVSTLRLALMTVATVLSGCGADAYVLIVLESARAVPTEVTRVELATTSRDGGRDFGRQPVAVDGFPLEVLFEPEGATPNDLRLTADVFLEDTPVASVTADYTWRDGKTTRVRLPLD